MFTLADTPVTFTCLSILLAFAGMWSSYELYRSRTASQILCNVAHLAMATVMLVSVPAALWRPVASVISIRILIGAFLGAVVLFCWLGVAPVRGDATRGFAAHFFRDAAMMTAMAWHLGAMAVTMPDAARSALHAHLGMMMADGNGREMRIVAVVGLPAMAYLLISSALSLVRAVHPSVGLTAQPAAGPATTETFRDHRRAVGEPVVRLPALAQFAMSFSMLWMSVEFLNPILPFVRHLGF